MEQKTLIALANERNFEQLEESWMAAFDRLPGSLDEMLHAIEWLVKAKERPRAEVLLSTMLESMTEQALHADLLAACQRMTKLFPASAEVRAAYGRALCGIHKDNPAVAGIVAKSGLTADAPLETALAEINRRVAIRKGDYALHRRRRLPVRIEGFDGATDTIALTDGSHSFTAGLTTFWDQYEHLDDHDFRAMKTFSREKLVELAEHEPETLVVSYLKYAGKQSTFRDFRETLQSCAVAPDDWKAWWARVKTLLVANPMIDLGDGSQPALSLRDSPRIFSEHIIRDFDFAEEARLKGALVLHYLGSIKSGTPLNDTVISHFRSKLGKVVAAGEPGACTFSAWLALGTAACECGFEPPPYSVAWLKPDEACAQFAHWCSWEQVYVAPCLKMIPESDKHWHEVFARMLPYAPVAMAEQCAAALLKAGHSDLVERAAHSLEPPAAACAEAYAWMWKMSAAEREPPVSLPVDLRAATMGMLKLIRQLYTANNTSDQNFHEALAALRHTLGMKRYETIQAVFHRLGSDQTQTLYHAIAGNAGLSTPMRSQLVHMLSRSGGIAAKQS